VHAVAWKIHGQQLYEYVAGVGRTNGMWVDIIPNSNDRLLGFDTYTRIFVD